MAAAPSATTVRTARRCVSSTGQASSSSHTKNSVTNDMAIGPHGLGANSPVSRIAAMSPPTSHFGAWLRRRIVG